MNIKAALKSNDGFTLIELMMASVIFTFGLVAVLSSVMTMIGQQRYAEYDAISANYINFYLEDLQDGITLSGNINNVPNYLSPFDGTQLFTAGGGTQNIPELGQVTVEMTQGNAGPGDDSVEVMVAITLTDYRGRNIVKSGSRIITY